MNPSHGNFPSDADGFLAFTGGETTINVIYDAAEVNQYSGTLAIDIDATATSHFPKFGADIWLPFVTAVKNYWNGYSGIDVTVHDAIDTIAQAGQPGGGLITQIPNRSLHVLGERSLLDQQVCAKPVDMRPAVQPWIPNWNLQQPHKTYC
jgi:hypothetical protein